MDFRPSAGKLLFSLVLGIVIGAAMTLSLTSSRFAIVSAIAAIILYLVHSAMQRPAVQA